MKVITIMSAQQSTACEDEAGGEVPKLSLPLVRREFLKGSGLLIGTLAAGSVLAGLAPSTVWAVELKTLSKSEGETLMKMGRTLYPHRKLPDAVYALLAKISTPPQRLIQPPRRNCAKAVPCSTKPPAAASSRPATQRSRRR